MPLSRPCLFGLVFGNYYQNVCWEFIFSKVLCFQHILPNTFTSMCLKYENCSLRDTLVFKHSNNIEVAAWNYNSLIAKILDGNHKNENFKPYLGNKEQRATFPVVFPFNPFFGFTCPIFTRPIGCATKIVCPKNEARWNQVCAGLILIGFYGIHL